MDYEQQIAQALRRQQDAQARSQYQAPQGRMAGRVYVAPNALEYVANLLRSSGAGLESEMAGKQAEELGQKKQTAVTEALRNFGQASQGQAPAQLAPEEQQAYAQMGDTSPTIGGVKPDMNAAYGYLMAAPDAALRQAGMQGMIRAPEVAAERQFKQEQLQAEAQMRADQMRQQHEQRMEYLRQNNADRAAMQQEQRAFQQQMAQIAAANRQASAQPYFQPVQTAQGVMAFNARTGRVEPVMGPNGQPVVGAAADPALQGAIAGRKAGETVTAKTEAERRAEAPQVIQQGEATIKLVDDLLASPGFGQAVGFSRLMGVQNIPGTAAKDFDVRLDQLKGQQFLQAFESLKGGGAITEVEGKKATDAISRMNASSSEAEFRKAAKEFQDVIRVGVQRARSRTTPAQGEQPAAPRARIRFDAQGNVIP